MLIQPKQSKGEKTLVGQKKQKCQAYSVTVNTERLDPAGSATPTCPKLVTAQKHCSSK